MSTHIHIHVGKVRDRRSKAVDQPSEGGFFNRKNIGKYKGFFLRTQNEPGKPVEYWASNSSGFTIGPFRDLPSLKARIDKDG